MDSEKHKSIVEKIGNIYELLGQMSAVPGFQNLVLQTKDALDGLLEECPSFKKCACAKAELEVKFLDGKTDAET